jgi:hypothetical protein
MAYRMIKERFKYDINGFAYKNFRALKKLKDTQKGKEVCHSLQWPFPQ